MPWLAILIAVACACGGANVAPPQRARAPADYTATRWIPAAPTYALSARSVRDLQRAVIDLVETFGIALELEVADVSRAFRSLGVDPLAPDALAAIGIDVEGGAAVFSEAISPTFVLRLAAPDRFAAFVRARRLPAKTELGPGASVEWVVADRWLWIRVALPIDPAREPLKAQSGNPTWSSMPWATTMQSAATPVSRTAGFIDAPALVAKLSQVDTGVQTCAKLVAPISRVAITTRGDGKLAVARLAFDIDAIGAAAIRAALRSPPEGWDAASRSAAFAIQWNVDVPKLLGWAAGCTQQRDLSFVERAGVRTARAMVFSFEASDPKASTGAIALDLSSRAFIDSLLDRIPWRHALETYERFGSWTGHSISVPFGPTIDYVLTDRIALAGIGEGVLARAVGKGEAHTAPPVLAIDLRPGGMSATTWRYLFALTRAKRPERAAERLQRWKELHVTIVLDGMRLVFEAAGSRR